MILNDADNIMIGNTEVMRVYAGDNVIWTRDGFRELRGVPPLTFRGNGTPLIDWSITGADGGVGNVGTNKLQQREYSSADGLSNQSTDLSKRENIIINFYSLPVVPPNTPGTATYQQWIIAETSYIGDNRYEYTADDRPCDYEHCQFFCHLKAGSYKLVCEYYRDLGYPWLLRNHDNQNPYIALLTENNATLVKKSMNQAYAPVVQDPLFDGYNSYMHDFYHEEYPFTLSTDTSVGFISKIYPQYDHNVFTRFQIVSADTTAVPFYIDANVNGVTCWEPHIIIIPVVISSGGMSTTINIPIDSKLTASDTLTMSVAGVTLPTYSGMTTIDIDTDITPTDLYIKHSI